MMMAICTDVKILIFARVMACQRIAGISAKLMKRLEARMEAVHDERISSSNSSYVEIIFFSTPTPASIAR